MLTNRGTRQWVVLGVCAGLALLLSALSSFPVASADGPPAAQATTLLDFSGLAPLGAGTVLAVHDAKNPGELDRPRLSLLRLTGTPQGVTWEAVPMEWPDDLGAASDLESASAIPGESTVVLAESGDDGTDFQRLFFVDVSVDADGAVTADLAAVARWPIPVFNVESVAVAQVGDEHVLLYAERAEGDPSTTIEFAPLSLSDHQVGPLTGVVFTSPAVRGPDDRPISAMAVGPDGRIYVASAYDPGDDDGPFSSSIFVAGWIEEGREGPRVIIPPVAEPIATLDGFKVESLALIDGDDGVTRLYAGTDDEDYGGVLRPVPLDR